MNAVMSLRPTPIQYKCSRAELSLHTTAADDCSDPTQTHTHKGTLHSLTSHTLIIPDSQRRWNSEQCWEMQPAGSHWVSPLSLLCPFSLSVCLCCDCHSTARLSSFISHTFLGRREMASVFSRLRDFSNFSLSMPCTYLSLLSLPAFLSFLCMWAEAEANPRPICTLAQSQAWMPLYLNNRAERVDADPHLLPVWFLFSEVSVWVVIVCEKVWRVCI